MHSSSSPSQRRVMAAVEIPSPKLPPPPRPPLPEVEPEAPTRDVTASFSSISSLSSIPPSTQSSSRRVVKHGVQAVTNSDSGSEDSESEEELADISAFIPQKRRKLTPPGKSVELAIEIPSTVKPAARQSKRLSDRDKHSSTASTPRTRLSPPQTVYKHSLKNMVKQREKQDKAEAKIRDMEAVFEQAQRRRAEDVQLNGDLDGGLKAAVADDKDESERMRLAMERTEALQDEEKFYYFRKDGGWKAPIEFPDSPYLPQGAQTLLRASEQTRINAFVTGFVTELASRERISDEFYCWMADQLVHEQREDLREAYAEALVATAANSTTDLVLLGWFGHFYRHLDPASRKDQSNGQRHDKREAALCAAPDGLRYALRVVEASLATNTALPQDVAYILAELALANIDENICSDTQLRIAVQDTIENILDNVHDEKDLESVCWHLCQTVNGWKALSLQIQCRAIASLPACSERAHCIRRILALHLVTGKIHDYQNTVDMNSSSWFVTTLTRLKKDQDFAITESTKYTLLNALICVLDIAVDNGFSDFAFLSTNKASTAGAFIKPSQPEQDFNKHIDDLSSQLRLISSRIRDAGTSHLRRTEAKNAIERLTLRLEYGVRTRPKPRKGVFADGTGDLQKAFLSGFVTHVPATAAAAVEVAQDVGAVRVVREDKLGDEEGNDSDESAAPGADDDST